MTARDIFNGSTGNRARILILDDATGKPKTGVAYNAAGLSINYKVDTGSEVTISLSGSNWHETGGGKYLVDVADTVYESGNLGKLIQFYGALTGSSVYGEQHRVVAYNPLAGDATEAKQDQIISLIQGSEVLTVASPNVRGNLVLTQGDTYDGAAGSNPKATWTVTTDYTDGWTVVLTIRDKNDAVVYTNTGTVPNATTVTVPIVTPTVTPFDGCPGVWQGKYDVQLSKSTSKKTIAIGVVYINEDQTRS